MNETYTERLFSGSIEEIRELHAMKMSAAEIATKVNLSEYLVTALIERFVDNWDNYSALPSPRDYDNEH